MGKEKYQMGYSDKLLQSMSARSVAYEAAHVARLIRPGLKLLDVGCGPGSMTLEFAELAQPGQVTGLDLNAEQLARPRAQAKTRGLDNIHFRRGDVYQLPFAADSFDIVSQNGMLMHLAQPAAAIAEMKRVLKPGGHLALRDLYASGTMLYGSAPCPLEGGLARINAVLVAVHRQLGADFDAGIKHRGWLQAAGCVEIASGASPVLLASAAQWQATLAKAELSAQNWRRISREAIALGLLTASEADEYKAWQDGLRTDPAAVNLRMWFHTTGRKAQ